MLVELSEVLRFLEANLDKYTRCADAWWDIFELDDFSEDMEDYLTHPENWVDTTGIDSYKLYDLDEGRYKRIEDIKAKIKTLDKEIISRKLDADRTSGSPSAYRKSVFHTAVEELRSAENLRDQLQGALDRSKNNES